MSNFKVGDRARIARSVFGEPDIDKAFGAVGTITDVLPELNGAYLMPDDPEQYAGAFDPEHGIAVFISELEEAA